jgi:hypothetical protein
MEEFLFLSPTDQGVMDYMLGNKYAHLVYGNIITCDIEINTRPGQDGQIMLLEIW